MKPNIPHLDIALNPAAILACAASASDVSSVLPFGGRAFPTDIAETGVAYETVERIAVIDPFDGGHHFPWMVDFCLSFLENGIAVTALYPDPQRLLEAVQARVSYNAPAFDAVSSEGMIVPSDKLPLSRRLITAARNWSRVQQRLDSLPRDLRPDAVFFAYVDGLLSRGIPPLLVDRLFTYRWSALYMKPIWMRLGRQLWPELESSVAWCLQADNCHSVAVLDEGVVDRLSRLLPHKSILHLPDFLPGDSEAVQPRIFDEIAQRARGRCVIGVVGSLQSRKGISTLLRIALNNPDSPYFFVFAGEFVPNGFTREEVAMWRSAIENVPENCYIRTSTIESEVEYVALANTCDIFYAAYLQFPNSSNALAWAAWLKKPVIVSEGFLMEERVRRYHLGTAIPEGNESACRAAMDEIRQRIANKSVSDYGFARYLQQHSRQQLNHGIRRLTQTFVQ